jgi:hypothetical protein
LASAAPPCTLIIPSTTAASGGIGGFVGVGFIPLGIRHTVRQGKGHHGALGRQVLQLQIIHPSRDCPDAGVDRVRQRRAASLNAYSQALHRASSHDE